MSARRWLGLAFSPLLATGCDGTTTQVSETRTWITETAYEIGDAIEGDALFSRLADVRVTPDGNRVLALDAGSGRLTVWTPEGSLVADVGGRGQGPGEFENPSQVEFHSSGFLVRDSRRFTLYGGDGALLHTVPPPPPTLSFQGFRLQPRALLEGGGHLARPLVPARVVAGWDGDDPVHEWPVFLMRPDSAGWAMDTVVVLDMGNSALSVRPADGSFAWGYHGPQPYGDSDLDIYDSRTGSVVVVQRSGGSGGARLLEVAANGDTIWDRSLQFPAIPISGEVAAKYIEEVAERISARSVSSASRITDRQAAVFVEDALYLPEFYPAVDFVEGMSEGDVWLRTHETVDTLQVWYAVRRGDNQSPPRRVLLPRTFYPSDLSGIHVWGIRYDTLGVNYVVGRRMVPVESADAADGQAWKTAPEFALGGESAGETPFWFVSDVSVGPDGIVYVAESARARRVTAWEPRRGIVLELGPSSGAEEFGPPLRIRPDPTGFWVTYGRRFVRYAADGSVRESVGLPPQEDRRFARIARVEDGLFFAVGRRPTNVGVDADEAVWDWPLFRIEQVQAGWTTDTVAVLDASGTVLTVNREDGDDIVPSAFFTTQPFAKTDVIYDTGRPDRVGIALRRGPPGTVRLFELSPSGDTAWRRRVSLPPQRLAPQRAHATLQSLVQRASVNWDPDRHVPEDILRERVADALHRDQVGVVGAVEGHPHAGEDR